MATVSTPPIKTAHAIAEKGRTSDVLTEENFSVDFASMFLSDAVTGGLHKVGFEKPSPIQLKAIPLGRCGLDLIVQAKSGTGKTCVFTVIALESLDLASPSIQVLVLAPTREIAVQIQETFQAIGCEMKGLRCHVFIGGTLFGPDRQKLKKCHVAVGTPGRIKQLIEYDVLKKGSIRLFILDEADKLLEENFQEQINWIYKSLPDNKQMLALSATYPEYLAKHLTKYMREPTFVRLNPKDLALKGIKQLYVELPGHSLPNKAFEIKVVKLLEILTQVSFNQCLVFSNLQTRAQNLCDILCDRGWPSECISGSQEQSQRLSAMSKLKKFQCRILISTDLSARGIDAENVNLIINLDIPTDTKTYLHRIGRAGRFGTHGAAISLACRGRDVDLLRNIQRHCRLKMTELPDPAPADLLKQDSWDSATYLGSHLTSPDLDVSTTDQAFENINHGNKKSGSKGEDPTSCLIENGEVNGASKETSHVSGRQKNVQDQDVRNDGKEHRADALPEDSATPGLRSDGFSSFNATERKNKVGKGRICRGTRKNSAGACIMIDAAVQTVEVCITQGDVSRQGSKDTVNAQQRKPVLPLGFEDAPDVPKLNLLLLSQYQVRVNTRSAWSWYEAKKSCEEFLRTKSGLNHKESIDETENIQSLHTKEPLPLSTPLKDIKYYRELIAKSFSQESRIPVDIPKDVQGSKTNERAKGEEEESQKQTFSTDQIPTENTMQQESWMEKISEDKNQKARAQLRCVKTNEHAQTHDVPGCSVAPGQKEEINSIVFQRDIDDSVESGEAEQTGQIQSDQSSCSERKQISEDARTDPREGNDKARGPAKVVRTRKDKGRIKEHVFTMSTLGALMSHEELNVAVSKSKRKQSSGREALNGSTRQDISDKNEHLDGVTKNLINSVNEVVPDWDTHHLPKMETRDESSLPSHAAQVSDSQSKQQCQQDANVEKLDPEDLRSNTDTSTGDPVWAIFRGYITKKPSKHSSTQEEESDISSDSSSSLCESDTSTSSEGGEDESESALETDGIEVEEEEEDESEPEDEMTEGINPAVRCGPVPPKHKCEEESKKCSETVPKCRDGGKFHQYEPYVGNQGSSSGWSAWYGASSHHWDPWGGYQTAAVPCSTSQTVQDHYARRHSPYQDASQGDVGTGYLEQWYPGVYGGGDWNAFHNSFGYYGHPAYPYYQ